MYKPAVYSSGDLEITMKQVTAKTTPAHTFSFISEVPGTDAEKKVYDLLVRLGVRFQFKYNWMEDFQTAFKESIVVPAFILPDYQNTVIEVKPAYTLYLSTTTLDSDNMKRQYALLMGYTLIQYGLPTYPTGNVTGAKYIVWSEDEIRQDVDFIFNRDLPEVFVDTHKPTYEPENFADRFLKDRRSELQRLARLEKGRIVRRMVPKLIPKLPKQRVKRLGKTQPATTPAGSKNIGKNLREVVQQPVDLI